MTNSLHITSINVHYRRLGHICNMTTVGGWTCNQVGSCKGNLIVYYDMNSSAGFVSFQRHHLSNFIYDTLTCNRSIAMNYDWQDFFVVFVFVIYLGAADPFNQSGNCFQVRWVWRKVYRNFLT